MTKDVPDFPPCDSQKAVPRPIEKPVVFDFRKQLSLDVSPLCLVRDYDRDSAFGEFVLIKVDTGNSVGRQSPKDLTLLKPTPSSIIVFMAKENWSDAHEHRGLVG